MYAGRQRVFKQKNLNIIYLASIKQGVLAQPSELKYWTRELDILGAVMTALSIVAAGDDPHRAMGYSIKPLRGRGNPPCLYVSGLENKHREIISRNGYYG